MNIKVIKRPIPEEICEDGGASVVIVGKETVDLETSIDEAKDVLIVVGDKLLVKGMFVGLFTSMVKGIERDGNARQLGDFITLYPVPTGEFDLDKGWQSGVNGVRIRARLMNELEIDISKWEFEDVTPGRQAFTLGSIECGERQLGVVDFVHPVWINGKPLPGTDEIRIDWSVEGTDRHGTIAADKVTSTASRATIAADALDELKDEQYDGKTIVFTVRGNFASAKISAKLKVAAAGPTVDDIASEGREGEIVIGTAFAANGSGLDAFDAEAGDTVKVKWTQGGEDKEATIAPAEVAADKLSFEFPDALVGVPADTELTFEITFGETMKSKAANLVEE